MNLKLFKWNEILWGFVFSAVFFIADVYLHQLSKTFASEVIKFFSAFLFEVSTGLLLFNAIAIAKHYFVAFLFNKPPKP